ncbi:TPA: hypothetical protein UM348_001043 [Stenotrophomonas maltophilia]|nr:hypothetical protein [Stenotrophomonas sp.]HEL4148343.1 hypothetical protein [Stenotrophomonas maltophilia]
MAEFAPIFNTHGNGRKTHLVIDDEPALCGMQLRNPHHMWSTGDYIPLNPEQVAWYLDPDTQDTCCRVCKAKLRAIAKENAHG